MAASTVVASAMTVPNLASPLLAGLLLIAGGCDADSSPASVVTARCQTDREISAGSLAGARAPAIKFANDILNRHARPAYGQLSDPLSKKVSAEQFSRLIDVIAFPAPFTPVSVQHAYRAELKSESPQPVVCGTLSDTSTWVAVAALPAIEQYHFLLTSRSRNNDWAIALWMVPSDAGWKVQAFHVGMQTTGGRDAAKMLGEARVQASRGHALNAGLLYAALSALVDRGPDFQLGLSQDVRRDSATFKPSGDIAGTPPLAVSWNGHRYSIDKFEAVGIGPALYLTIYFSDPSWNGSDNAKAELCESPPHRRFSNSPS